MAGCLLVLLLGAVGAREVREAPQVEGEVTHLFQNTCSCSYKLLGNVCHFVILVSSLPLRSMLHISNKILYLHTTP